MKESDLEKRLDKLEKRMEIILHELIDNKYEGFTKLLKLINEEGRNLK